MLLTITGIRDELKRYLENGEAIIVLKKEAIIRDCMGEGNIFDRD
jgi:hypothetical protein